VLRKLKGMDKIVPYKNKNNRALEKGSFIMW
jgi:hypothetical protein